MSKIDLTLPFPSKVLEQHTIVLGKTRSGKSSKLRLMVEHLLDNDEPVCIIDPKGDWWGIKSSADGKKAGFPVIIFGSKHADIQINDRSGAHVAELVATGNRPCVIDLGGWRLSERTRFFIEFSQAFFIHTRGMRWLVIDECHNFVPKGKIFSPDIGEMLHWGNRLASEGQGKGIILLSASQRPQKVHNDYLTSHETLIACRVIHKADRDAIKDWIDGCGDPVIGKDMIGALAAMQRPEAWVWSPEIGFGPKRLAFPMFRTFDSFKPQSGTAHPLKGWAAVNLDEVRGKLAKVVEEAEANDPAKLKAEIARLKKDLAKASQQTSRPVEKINISDPKAIQAARVEGFVRGLETAKYTIDRVSPAIREALKGRYQGIVNELNRELTGKSFDLVAIFASEIMSGLAAAKATASRKTAAPAQVITPKAAPAPRLGARAQTANGSLPKAERAILAVLAHFPAGASPAQVSRQSGYSIRSSSFSNALSALRTAGYLQPGKPLRITQEGAQAVPEVPPLPTGPDLLAYWLGHQALGKAERAMLEYIVAKGGAVTKGDISQATGYSVTSSSFSNALSTLRTLQLIQGRGDEITAAEDFH